MKLCNDCGKLKRPSAFSFRKNTNATKKVYRKPYCKACDSARTKKWYLANRERALRYQKKHRNKMLRSSKNKK